MSKYCSSAEITNTPHTPFRSDYVTHKTKTKKQKKKWKKFFLSFRWFNQRPAKCRRPEPRPVCFWLILVSWLLILSILCVWHLYLDEGRVEGFTSLPVCQFAHLVKNVCQLVSYSITDTVVVVGNNQFSISSYSSSPETHIRGVNYSRPRTKQPKL